MAATLVLGFLLAGCSFFGEGGTPGSAHIQFQHGDQVNQADANLKIKAIPTPPKNPEYRVIIYHNVNTVGAFVPEEMTVPVGATVEWIWTDQYDQHNVWWIDQELINSPTKLSLIHISKRSSERVSRSSPAALRAFARRAPLARTLTLP